MTAREKALDKAIRDARSYVEDATREQPSQQAFEAAVDILKFIDDALAMPVDDGYALARSLREVYDKFARKMRCKAEPCLTCDIEMGISDRARRLLEKIESQIVPEGPRFRMATADELVRALSFIEPSEDLLLGDEPIMASDDEGDEDTPDRVWIQAWVRLPEVES